MWKTEKIKRQAKFIFIFKNNLVFLKIYAAN